MSYWSISTTLVLFKAKGDKTMSYIDDQETQKANLRYIRNAMDQPLLDKDHELDLARRWRDSNDERALHELVQSYQRLVISIAAKFRNYGLPMGDLIQEGNVGMMQAAAKFEPDRELRFSTYATWWIRSCIQDYVLRNWSIVRTGTTAAHKSLFFNFRRLRAQIEGRNETEGLDLQGRQEIADELGVKLKDVETMEGRLSANDKSLNARITQDSNEEWQTFLEDEDTNPEDIVVGMKDAQTRSAWLNEALLKLSDREQKIIRERHLTDEVVTLESLGQDLGISKERVRQLEKRAMDKIKDTMITFVDDTDELFLQD